MASRYCESQQLAIYRWRAKNPDHYSALQRAYRHKYYHTTVKFKKAWMELLRLGDIYLKN